MILETQLVTVHTVQCQVNTSTRVHPAHAFSLISSSRHPSNRTLEINLSDTDGNISTIGQPAKLSIHHRRNSDADPYRGHSCCSRSCRRVVRPSFYKQLQHGARHRWSIWCVRRTNTPTKRAEDRSMQSCRQRAEHLPSR